MKICIFNASSPGGETGVLDVADGGHGVVDLVVDDGVDGDGDGVLGEDLLGRHVEGDRPEVGDDDLVDAGDDEEEAGADGAALLDAPESEDDSALVLLREQRKEQRSNP